MSGPNAPPMNQMLARNAGAAMRQFPGSMASDSAQYPQAKPQASSVPRPNALPVQAPQVPTPAPDPRKGVQAPAQAASLPPVMSRAGDFAPASDALRQALEAKARTMMNPQGPASVSMGWGGPSALGPPSDAPAPAGVPSPRGATMGWGGPPVQPGQPQTAVPAPVLPSVTPKDIAQVMAQKPQADPTQAPAPAPAPVNPAAMTFSNQAPKPAGSTGDPRAVPKDWYTRLTKGEDPVRATIPSQVLDRAMRAAKEGKKFSVPQLSEKTSTNKETKGGNLWFYKALGVEPGDKTSAAHAITKLQQKAQSAPWEITPAEDRILASASKSEGFHKSLEPAAIAGRKAEGQKASAASGYGDAPQEGQTTMQFVRPTFDPAATKVNQFIANAGTPNFQGSKMPTQADVNASQQAPAQFKQQFPTYSQPAPQAEEEGPPTDEED